MPDRIRRVWLWTKLIFTVLLVVWIGLFFYCNATGADSEVTVWLFFLGASVKTRVSILVLVSILAAALVFYLVRKVSGVRRELRELRAAEERRERDRKLDDLARRVEQQQHRQPPVDADRSKDEL